MDKIITLMWENIGLDIVWYIILYPFMIFWVRSILYTTKDISHRTDSISYQMFCILVVTIWTPFIWFPLYFILRPYRTLDDTFRRKHIESFWKECLECWQINHKDSKFCISCWNKLDTSCKECKKEYSKSNEYCPYCWAPNLENY